MAIESLLLIAVFLPLFIAPVVGFFARSLSLNVAWIGIGTAITSASLIGRIIKLTKGLPFVISYNWVPAFDLQLSFLVDGLSLFFGLVITCIGAFVLFYARFYMSLKDENGRFFAYLMLFMFAMLGTVFSNHLLLTFLFWELTGVASFLLIGFLYNKPESQKGSLMALIVTGTTGLVMLLGILLAKSVFGTYDLSLLIAQRDSLVVVGALPTAVMALMLVGAFGKSAQFPFHFWLPNAMAAPTPVSSYLHSAAMVKLGIFLTARLFPIFSHNPYWGDIIVTVGFITMLIGAVYSILSHDLKAILAYTTVSQLGFLMGVYGLGHMQLLEHDFFHILNHVFYKASLFMVAGIVIHIVGTKDIRKMGGLFRIAPFAGMATLFACMAMAGLPGTMGFISKELMLETLLHNAQSHGGIAWVWVGTIIMSAICLFATSLRFFKTLFMGTVPLDLKDSLHAPGLWIQLPPLVLASCLIIFGLNPELLGHALAGLTVSGMHAIKMSHLALWHGLTTPFLLSLTISGLGVGLYTLFERKHWQMEIPKQLRFDTAFNNGLEGLATLSKRLHSWLRLDQSQDYLGIVISYIVLMSSGFILYYLPLSTIRFDWIRLEHIPATVIGFVICVFSIAVVTQKKWTTRLIALSVVGFFISFFSS